MDVDHDTADVVTRLQTLGLTEWEARAYLALLVDAPLSGYGVAKRSGIPRSKIYEVLRSLTEKGVATVARTEPTVYRPLPARALIERTRERITGELAAAEQALARFEQQESRDQLIWDIEGRDEIITRAHHLIRSATDRVMLEIWARDADVLRVDLRAAAGRGVEIVVVAYGDPGYPFAKVYSHPLTDQVTSGLGGRWLVLSVDNAEIIAGIISAGNQSRAAQTSHPGLVVPITELIAHDIYKLEMLRVEGERLEARFGPGLVDLRAKFSIAARFEAEAAGSRPADDRAGRSRRRDA